MRTFMFCGARIRVPGFPPFANRVFDTRLHFRDLRTLCGGDTRVTLSLCCCCTGTVLPLHFSVLLLAVVPAAIATAKIASESGQDWIVSMLATGNFTGSILTLVPMRTSAGCRLRAHCRCGLFVLGLFVVFPIAWKTGQDWIGSLWNTGKCTGSISTLAPTRATAGRRSHTHGRCGAFVFALFVVFLGSVSAGCPHCFGANPACTVHASARGTCPYEAVPSQNRAIIAGTSTSSLRLTHCILPRFLRCFERGELPTVTSLSGAQLPARDSFCLLSGDGANCALVSPELEAAIWGLYHPLAPSIWRVFLSRFAPASSSRTYTADHVSRPCLCLSVLGSELARIRDCPVLVRG